MANTGGGFTPKYFASNCDTSYNPARSAVVQALVSQCQSAGCRFGIVPLCEGASTAACIVIPADEGLDGGYMRERSLV
jgi:hypothetical protein